LNNRMRARKDGLAVLMSHRTLETDTRRLMQKGHHLEPVVLILQINGVVLIRIPMVLLISVPKISKVLAAPLSSPSLYLNNKINSTAKEAAVAVIKP
jgi:hypothetical protein